MAQQQVSPSTEDIRKAYIEEFLKRYPNASDFASFTEKELTDFIRRYENANFAGIYTCIDHNFYDRVRNKIATNGEMRAEDDAISQQYSVHLRTYSNFLESKTFKQLFKQKNSSGGKVSLTDMRNWPVLVSPRCPSLMACSRCSSSHSSIASFSQPSSIMCSSATRSSSVIDSSR